MSTREHVLNINERAANKNVLSTVVIMKSRKKPRYVRSCNRKDVSLHLTVEYY